MRVRCWKIAASNGLHFSKRIKCDFFLISCSSLSTLQCPNCNIHRIIFPLTEYNFAMQYSLNIENSQQLKPIKYYYYENVRRYRKCWAFGKIWWIRRTLDIDIEQIGESTFVEQWWRKCTKTMAVNSWCFRLFIRFILELNAPSLLNRKIKHV